MGDDFGVWVHHPRLPHLKAFRGITSCGISTHFDFSPVAAYNFFHFAPYVPVVIRDKLWKEIGQKRRHYRFLHAVITFRD
jgi:hypothetical protein